MTNNTQKPTLALVGTTGAVGTVMLELLSTRADVWGEIRLIASARSAGKVLQVRGEDVVVQEIAPEVFDGVDVAMFVAPDEVSQQWAPVAVEHGAIPVVGQEGGDVADVAGENGRGGHETSPRPG